eukprot:TRINITY_DN2210_c0_g1_i1.p1 TRINITY_DN2210_c0_g1~~TRINITY_DN2210_c0_g1_i1.p1  ORF type:complete len:447 (-),score=108.41 TRINITY_DN2210_c0_g1_i1:72-1412(-)
MGIEFRDGRYLKRVWMGKRTVKEGEAAAVWSLSGRHRQIVGPRREHLFFSTIRFLDRFTARNGEYLVVKHKNGTVEHVRGPRTMFLDPVQHDEIYLRQAIQLQSSSEAIVVYSSALEAKENEGGIARPTMATFDEKDEKGQFDVTRRVLRGPAIFVPNVGEWVQSFSWTKAKEGSSQAPAPVAESNARASTATRAADGSREVFSVLSTAQTRYAVKCAMRSSDNVKLSVNVSLVVKLINIDIMLATSSDPVADLLAAIQSDVNSFGSTFSSSELNQLGDAKNLGNLDRFQQLFKCAKSVGFEVTDVLITGFAVSDEMQKQQDEYNSRQAKLKSEMAEAEQKQSLQDMELMNRTKRADAERAIERAELEHKLELEKIAQREHVEERVQRNKETIEFLGDLKGLGVDLTQLLVVAIGKKSEEIPEGLRILNPPALEALRKPVAPQHGD